jgi:hypothetical protein
MKKQWNKPCILHTANCNDAESGKMPMTTEGTFPQLIGKQIINTPVGPIS